MKSRSIPTPMFAAALLWGSAAHAQQQLDWSLEPVPGNGVRIFGADTDFVGGVWVAGHFSLQQFPFELQNFIARWDGSQWIETPVPQPANSTSGNDHTLQAIAALGPDDAIAVGGHDSLSANVTVPQSMRWNGSSWEVLDPPAEIINSGNGSGGFEDVSRTGDTVWGVGQYPNLDPDGADVPIIQFYATRLVGGEWETHIPPLYEGIQNPELSRYLANAVAGASPDDVWLGGRVQQIGAGPDGAVLIHWNGSEWNWSDIWPLFESNIADIEDIAAIASDDVWAVGEETVVDGTDTRVVPVILHWDGTQWSRSTAPDEPDRNVILRTIVAHSPSEIYAAGVAWVSDGPPEAYLLRYDGQEWSTVPDVQLADGSQFFASAISNDGELWLAGRSNEFPLQGLAQYAFMNGSSCPADINGDGNLDFFDISGFLNAFSAGDPIADLTGDGTLDFFDVSTFLTGFSAGCP